VSCQTFKSRRVLNFVCFHSFLEKRAPKFVGNVMKTGNGTNGTEYGMPENWPWWRDVNTNDPTGKSWPDIPVKNIEDMEPFFVELRGPKKAKL